MKRNGRVFTTIGRFINFATVGSAATASLCLLTMSLLVTADVAGRYILNSPIKFADEISEYSLLAIAFLGLGLALKEGAHIKIDVITMRLPQRIQDWLEGISSIVALFYVVFFIYYTYQLVIDSYSIGAVSIVMRAPVFVVQAVMPIGLTILALLLVAQIFNRIQTLRKRGKGPARG